MTSRTGAIAITGASGQVGTVLRRRLGAFPNDVRPLARHGDLAGAFRDAEVVVHLAGTLRPEPPNTYVEANLRTVKRTVAALEGSSVERVVFLSYLGADPASSNEYLRTKGLAEELLRNCGRDLVVFRCSHIYGPPEEPGPFDEAFLSKGGRPVRILGSGRQRIAPVFREDVVEAIVRAALDPATYHGRYDLTGPETMTVDEFALALNGGTVTLRHVPPRLVRPLGHVIPGLPPALVEIMLADSVGDRIRAPRAFGLELRTVADVYRSSRPAAA